LAPKLVTIDGAARWTSKQGIERSVGSLSSAGDDRGDAVFTALRTEFAFALLAACVDHWQEHRKVYSAAKLLVVAPDIQTAKSYQSRLASICLSEIATTDDTAAAYRAIEDYKRGAVDALVTVGMAYEGLLVRQITHIACLTEIRSWPWLEQMAARANRLDTGKKESWIFAPADQKLIEAWNAIENETMVPLSDRDDWGDSVPTEEIEDFGFPAARLTPLWSEAHGIEMQLPAAPAQIAPSVAEGVLRENIRAMRRAYVDNARPGSQQARATVFNLTIRSVVDKDLDHMDTVELTAVWMELRRKIGDRLK
jgi:hypothetical protein